MPEEQHLPATPNCVDCLHPMEPAGTLQRPYWLCNHCGAVALTS